MFTFFFCFRMSWLFLIFYSSTYILELTCLIPFDSTLYLAMINIFTVLSLSISNWYLPTVFKNICLIDFCHFFACRSCISFLRLFWGIIWFSLLLGMWSPFQITLLSCWGYVQIKLIFFFFCLLILLTFFLSSHDFS